MPRVTTSSHPLARLRATCGWTREDAAKIAGITAASVQNIEINRAPISEDAARRIEATTGCLAASLMAKQSVPLRLDGNPYERQTYQNYQAASTAEPDAVEAAAADLQFRIRTLLAASGNKFLYVVRRFSDALDAVLNEAGISLEALESFERKSASVSVSEMTIAQLRKKIGPAPALLQWLEAHPQPEKSKCKVVDESYQHWPTTEFESRIVIARSVQRHRYRIEFADGQRLEVLAEKWTAKGISFKGTPHPELGGSIAMIPSPALSRPRKRGKTGSGLKR